MRSGSQPVAGRLPGEAVARQGRNDQVERVLRAPAVRGGIGQRLDDLQLLDDRAGPAVRDDERQRVLVLRPHMDEVDVEPVDLGDELRKGVQPRLDLPPVVVGRPVARELLHRRQLHALRRIGDGLLFGPARRGDALPEVDERLFRHLEAEGADGGCSSSTVSRSSRSWPWWSPFQCSSASCGCRHPRRSPSKSPHLPSGRRVASSEWPSARR